MFFFTPHERRALIFIGVVFGTAVCLDILFKSFPFAFRRLTVLDEPLLRSKTDINRATYEELLAVPGLGPSSAARIIHARESRGRFASVEELRGIRRISGSMFERAARHLAVEAE